jgi:hypothetical protein
VRLGGIRGLHTGLTWAPIYGILILRLYQMQLFCRWSPLGCSRCRTLPYAVFMATERKSWNGKGEALHLSPTSTGMLKAEGQPSNVSWQQDQLFPGLCHGRFQPTEGCHRGGVPTVSAMARYFLWAKGLSSQFYSTQHHLDIRVIDLAIYKHSRTVAHQYLRARTLRSSSQQ